MVEDQEERRKRKKQKKKRKKKSNGHIFEQTFIGSPGDFTW